MTLKRFSLLFSLTVIGALSANALSLLMIQQAYHRVITEQNHRQRAMRLTDELRQETEQLSRLVREYTSTGQTSYLTYYYDILAIRQGEKPQPEQYLPGAYWDMVIAGRLRHRFPVNGTRSPIADRMKSLGFSKAEIHSLTKVLAATEAMKQIEQVAFAATQGLYDPRTENFVSDGEPDLRFAGQLVHSQKYNRLKADLAESVMELVTMVDQRTTSEVGKTSKNLERWILLTLGSVLFTFLMVLAAFLVIRRHVLQPIGALSNAAKKLAQGDYATRSGVSRPKDSSTADSGLTLISGSEYGVDELRALGATLDSMAESIERDITLRRQIQQQLEAANTKAENATRTKSMFLANMSHEIRTPMNAIIGMAYLALKTDLTPRQKDYIGKVHHAAKSLLVLINDILDFSKVEAGKLNLEHARFSLEEVVGNTMSMLYQRAQEKEIELLLDLSEPLLLERSNFLIGDAFRLGQIITNLLSNSVKFTHQGYVKLAIRIESDDAETITLRFTVTDSGIGMTPEHVVNLFQVFTQADGSTTRKYGGTGLGLTIAKKLVELMGGSIRVESAIEQGSCFSFTARFGLARSDNDSSYALTGHDRMRVLVVDDNPEARQVLCGLLTAMWIGARLDTRGIEGADHGAQALQMIQAAETEGIPYNLLLLDWAMPGMDGAQALMALRSADLAHPPLVAVVSAYDTDAMREIAHSLSPSSRFLPKPVLPEMLYALIRELTGTTMTPGKGRKDAAPLVTDLGGMRVLVVEDNPINRQLAVELLELRGVTTDVAHHGGQALKTISSLPANFYDLILMDLQMPEMDGYETVRRLRADRRYDTLPIVAMSAHALVEERDRCKSLGMQDHVSKPIDPDALYAVLARYYTKVGGQTAGSSETFQQRTKPPSTTPAALPCVKGLETAEGLRHTGNKVDIYLTLLRCFLAAHTDDLAQIRKAMDEERWADAERIAHTIKGLMGSIGAYEAQASAETLEHALRNRRPTWRECLTKLSELFIPLVSALSEHFPVQSAEGEERPGVVGAAPLPSWLDEFELLLDAGNFKATTLWESGKTELAGLLSTRTISRISSALENFDFAGAKLLAVDARLVISGNPRENL